MAIIPLIKSIIPACDVSLEVYQRILKDTSNLKQIGGYKLGFELGLEYGLPKIVELTKKYTPKILIYDHQKAGTDIPYTGDKFAKLIKKAGIDAIILFPQSGPETEKMWIESAFEQNLGVIVGGLMTHPKYIYSEGGFLHDESVIDMYLIAAELGVKDFVLPPTKLEKSLLIKNKILQKVDSPTIYTLGFGSQGGIAEQGNTLIGEKGHFIVGREIYNSSDIQKSVLNLSPFLK